MAIIEENAPTQQAVQMVNGMLAWIVDSNQISVNHVKKLLELLIKFCGIQVDTKTVEEWLTQITGTGGGLGGLKSKFLPPSMQVGVSFKEYILIQHNPYELEYFIAYKMHNQHDWCAQDGQTSAHCQMYYVTKN
ncbi:unnamed protein product [Rotaria socialis]|uniref:Uncharacterized protein n=1 Tax=Rotaria socialis TaxID=392032 RepID=A0A820XUY3_9BILA|nr:unnamed protein product [Rotaria socialis]